MNNNGFNYFVTFLSEQENLPTIAINNSELTGSNTNANVATIQDGVLPSNSSVSLRDILRVFKKISYLLKTQEHEIQKVFLNKNTNDQNTAHSAMLIAVAIVYYLRLTTDFRKEFRLQLQAICGRSKAGLEDVLIQSMLALMKETSLEPGIAKTQGLQENIFMIIICCLAEIPLMIIGPPGSSKTLAVTIVDENARGEYSKNEFYRVVPNLIPFRYQCSRQSSSNEIATVFQQAINRQAKANKDGEQSRCFVFMDEAGLPEEGRESMKVLHYYLEDHMKVEANAGFVAISNHMLDAAKTNRCAVLTRTKPDHEELMNVARGCLENLNEFTSSVPYYDKDGKEHILLLDPPNVSEDGLLSILCDAYDACMSERSGEWI